MGCTPICINGLIDQAVVDFSAGLMDILMELAFGLAPRADRWRDCGAKLVILAQTLKESAPPNWVDPPAREHDDLQSFLDVDVVFALDSDNEDQKCSFPSLAVDSSSLAGPSTSASAMAPSGQVAATASPSTPQGLPAGGIATAAQIPQLQNELGEAHRSLEALTITGRMSTAFFFIGYLTKSLLIREGCWSTSRQCPRRL